MLRVIQILHHSLGGASAGGEPESGGSGWHELVAREIAKRTNEVNIECWRPESSVDRTYVWTDGFGVTHKIYPSVRFRYGLEISYPLILQAQREAAKKKQALLHLHGILNLNTYMISLSCGGMIPIAAHSHDPLDPGSGRLQRIRGFMRSRALRGVDRYFLSTEEDAQRFSESGDAGKIRIAPLPVDLSVFRPIDKGQARMKLGWHRDDQYVLYVGRLEERKGLRYLMQASETLTPSLPRLHLVLVGSGPLAGISTSRVTFLGRVNYSELPIYYNAADLFVLPSLRESWGRVVIESLACQTPVIATRTGCVPTLMKEGMGGLFTIPMRDGTALANKLSEVLPYSDELRQRITRGKLGKFDSGRFVLQMLENYRELADMYN